MKKKFALVAELSNGKKVLVEPDYNSMKLGYRYLSDEEVADNTLYTEKNYVWHETPINKTVENRSITFFSTIDVTNIRLARV